MYFKWKFGALCVLFVCVTSSQLFEQEIIEPSIYTSEANTAYCFHFTWLGPKFDNVSQANGTCEEFGKQPCKEPLVITDDATPPNTTFMWNNFDRSQIACRLTRGEVCTKWVQYYASEVEFITYMCSKFTVNGKSKVDWTGCDSDSTKNDTFSNEVCACRSGLNTEPCNATVQQSPAIFLLVVGVLTVLLGTALVDFM